MQPKDISDGLKKLHKSSFIDYWEPSYDKMYDTAFKTIADKITHHISRPVYHKKKLWTYLGAGSAIKNRPIYTFAIEEPQSINNVLILRRRYFLNSNILKPQTPPGGIVKRIKENLKKQDVSKVDKCSTYYKSKNGTLSAINNVFFITLDSTFDDIIKFNKSFKSYYGQRTENDIEEWKEFYEIKRLEEALQLKFQGNLTNPELLILNELKLSEYIDKLPYPYPLSDNIKTLKNFLFRSYIIHLFCRNYNLIPEEFIKNFMTKSGRKKFLDEENQWEVEYQQEKEREEMEALWYGRCMQDAIDERKEIESELKYLSENGGDWIFD